MSMNRIAWAAVAGLAAASWGGGAEAATILASTSFENETPGVQYVDTLPANTNHALINNVGESPVNSTASSTLAGDLGFSARYENTRDDVGLTDGDFVGVTGFTGTVGAFTDGVQGYQMSDPDGRMIVEFAPVAIAGAPVEISLDRFIAETGWETSDPTPDAIIISVSVDAGPPIDILNTTGSDIDDLGIEGSWVTEKLTVSGSTAVLSVSLDANSGSEAIYLDNIVFTQVPEPSAFWALGVLGTLVVALRIRLG